MDITTIRDLDCGGAAVAPVRGRRAADADDDEKVPLLPWVQKCWLTITSSLHDEI